MPKAGCRKKEVLLLGFAHVLIITAIVTGNFVRAILSSFISCSFYGQCGVHDWKIILIEKEPN